MKIVIFLVGAIFLRVNVSVAQMPSKEYLERSKEAFDFFRKGNNGYLDAFLWVPGKEDSFDVPHAPYDLKNFKPWVRNQQCRLWQDDPDADTISLSSSDMTRLYDSLVAHRSDVWVNKFVTATGISIDTLDVNDSDLSYKYISIPIFLHDDSVFVVYSQEFSPYSHSGAYLIFKKTGVSWKLISSAAGFSGCGVRANRRRILFRNR